MQGFRLPLSIPLILFFSTLSGSELLKLNKKNSANDFRNSLYVYIDTTGDVRFENIINGDIKFVKKLLSSYYWDSIITEKKLSIWFKGTCEYGDSTDIGNFVFESYNYNIEKCWIYYPKQDGSYAVDSMGMSMPFNVRKHKHKNPLVNIVVPAGAKFDVYMRVIANKRFWPGLIIRNFVDFVEYTLRENYEKGFFNGFFTFVTLLNLFFFIFLRERSYFLYVVFTFSQTLYIMVDGFGFQFHWPKHPEINMHILNISNSVMVTTLLLFNLYFLKIKSHTKFLHFFGLLLAVFRIGYAVLGFDRIYYDNQPTIGISETARLLDTCIILFIFLIILYEFIKFRTSFNFFILMGHMSFSIGFLNVMAFDFKFYPMFITTMKNYVELSFPGFFFHICSTIHILFVSVALVDKIKKLKSENEKNQLALIQELEKNRKIQENINAELETKVKIRTEEINQQKEEILSQNEELSRNAIELENKAQEIRFLYSEITDSIETAKRIQISILVPLSVVRSKFKDIFILFKPKDIVSGDFYWYYHKNNTTYIAAVDCTGHGVAGALMSTVANNLLNGIIASYKNIDAGVILTILSENLVKTLHQDNNELETKDGLDISLCIIEHEKHKMQFSGANNSMYIIKNEDIQLVQATKRGVGFQFQNRKAIFATEYLDIDHEATYYIFSDGFASQFGGELGQEKLKYTRFREMLINNSKFPMAVQHKNIENYFNNWRGNVEQTDDVLLIGFKL